jgi:hypothetical protein
MREVIRFFSMHRKDFSLSFTAVCRALGGRIVVAKLITITIETNSVIVLRARSAGRLWCPRCSTEGEVLRFGSRGKDIGALAPLQALIESGNVHQQQAPDGSTLICLNSLMAFIHDRTQSRGQGLRAIDTTMEEI